MVRVDPWSRHNILFYNTVITREEIRTMTTDSFVRPIDILLVEDNLSMPDFSEPFKPDLTHADAPTVVCIQIMALTCSLYIRT